MSPGLANSRRSNVASGEKWRSSPVSVSTVVPLRQLAPSRAPRPLLDQPACASTWWRGVPPRRPGGVAVEIVELGHAGRDRDLVDEGDGVGQREGAAGRGCRRRRSRRRRRRRRRRTRRRRDRRRRRRPAFGRRPARRRTRLPPRRRPPERRAARGRSRTAARIWSITDCDGRRDFSGLEKSKPTRSVSRCALSKLTGRRSTLTSWPCTTHRATKRSGKAASIAGGHGDARDRTVDRLVDVIGAQPQVGLGDGCQLPPSLNTLRRSASEVRIAAGDRGRQAPSGRW